jgi:hypothetical protein
MHRLFLIALLAAAAACSHSSSSSTTPSNRTGAVVDGPLTSDSLVAFAQVEFPTAVAAGTLKLDFGSDGVAELVIEELGIMGVTTTGQLAAITPPDYDSKGFGAVAKDGGSTTIAGALRDLMIIHDARGYFTNAWRSNWSASPTDFPAPVAYGVDLSVMASMGVYDGGDPCGDEDEGDDGGDDPCGDPCGD